MGQVGCLSEILMRGQGPNHYILLTGRLWAVLQIRVWSAKTGQMWNRKLTRAVNVTWYL